MTKAEKKLLIDRLWEQVDYAKQSKRMKPDYDAYYSGVSKGLRDAIDIIENDYHKKGDK
jgi:hypothetical protein